MALIGKIRNRLGWLMLVLVALGVLGFLLMDATSMNQMGSGRDAAVVGEVNGKEILRNTMDNLISAYKDPNIIPEEAQAYAWQQLVEETLISQQVQKAGLAVTTAEMNELFVGNDMMISPLVRQNFGDPRTGQFDREMVRQTIASLQDPDMEGLDENQQQQVMERQQALKTLEKQVASDRTSAKYLAMLQKAMYAPSWMVETEYKRDQQTYNFSFVRVPYSAVGNDQAQVTDAELEKYLQENKKRYEREASASIEYVTFDVKPSQADIDAIKKTMDEVVVELKASQDDTATVAQFDGEFRPFMTREEMADESLELKDSLFGAELKVVIGPYISNNEYRVVKVLEKKIMPDSVRCRHVVRPVKTQDDYNREFKLLDSLKKAIVKGEVTFDTVASRYGTDGTKFKGGDLGFAGKGSFVKEFEQHIFHAAKKDSVDIIFTEFGIHLVQVTDYKFEKNQEGIRLAFFSEPIIPSANTVNTVRVLANEFIVKNKTLEEFRNDAKAQNLPKAEASGLEASAFAITGLGKNSTAAKIARWAHRSDINVNDVAREPYSVDDEALAYTKQFVVPALVSRTAKNEPSIQDPAIRREVERVVQNEKKAAIIKQNLQGVTDLAQAAAKYNVKVENTTNPVSYASAYIVGAGAEPKVMAVASMLELNKASLPIEGDQGVYLISLLMKNEGQPMQSVQTARMQVAQRAMMLVSQKLVEVMKKDASIEDNRHKIYY